MRSARFAAKHAHRPRERIGLHLFAHQRHQALPTPGVPGTSCTCWRVAERPPLLCFQKSRLSACGTSAFFPGYHWMFSAHACSNQVVGSLPPLP
jgi:hypothetical protein